MTKDFYCNVCGKSMPYKDDIGTLAWALGIGRHGLAMELSNQNPQYPPVRRQDLKGYWQCENHPEEIYIDFVRRRVQSI